MRKFSKLLVATFALAAISLTAGCKSDCEKLYDHTISLLEKEKDMPEEAMKEIKSEENKKKFLETECKKASEEEIKCALEADSMEKLAACDKKNKE